MNYYYADARNQPVGPVTIPELQRLVSIGTLSPSSWVIPQGETNWVPLSSVIPVNTPPPVPGGYGQPAAYQNPYSAPAVNINVGAPYGAVPPNRMPGLNRLGYFLAGIGLTVAFYIVMIAIMGPTFLELMKSNPNPETMTEAEAIGVAQKVMTPILLGALVMVVVSLFLMGARLRNIGWSPWLALLMLVPLVNIWIGGCCMILPPGYVHTKKLDTASFVLLALMLVGIVAGGALMYQAQKELDRTRIEYRYR